jgi:hypothetical protein
LRIGLLRFCEMYLTLKRGCESRSQPIQSRAAGRIEPSGTCVRWAFGYMGHRAAKIIVILESIGSVNHKMFNLSGASPQNPSKESNIMRHVSQVKNLDFMDICAVI